LTLRLSVTELKGSTLQQIAYSEAVKASNRGKGGPSKILRSSSVQEEDSEGEVDGMALKETFEHLYGAL